MNKLEAIYYGPNMDTPQLLRFLYLAGVRGKITANDYLVTISLDDKDNLMVTHRVGRIEFVAKDPSQLNYLMDTTDLVRMETIPYTFNIFEQLIKYPNIFTYHGPSMSRLFKEMPDRLLYNLLNDWWKLELYRIEGEVSYQKRKFIEIKNPSRSVIEDLALTFDLQLIPSTTVVILRTIEAILSYIAEYRIIILADNAEQIEVITNEADEGVEYQTVIAEIAFSDLKQLKAHYTEVGFDVRSAFTDPSSDTFRQATVETNKGNSFDQIIKVTTFSQWVKDIQSFLTDGAIGFVSDYITDWSTNSDGVNLVAEKIRGVLARQPITTSPLTKALNPAYSIYMPRTGNYPEYTGRVKSDEQLYIEDLCSRHKLNTQQVDILKQKAMDMGIYQGRPISRTNLCRIILSQYEIEQGERQTMKSLAE